MGTVLSVCTASCQALWNSSSNRTAAPRSRERNGDPQSLLGQRRHGEQRLVVGVLYGLCAHGAVSSGMP
ncbi:hypothetical protein SANTM175S_07907 [Streptomyces antimycoticus]